MNDEIVDTFMDNAAKAAAEPIRVHTDDELNAALAQILTESDAVFCPCVTDKEKLVSLSPGKPTEDYRAASVCVEEVFGAIAETGSVICSSHGGKILQAGLLPAHHVAMVSSEHLYRNLDDFFASLGDPPPTNITLETGPSRTADIELTLTVGVHGPGRLTIIVF